MEVTVLSEAANNHRILQIQPGRILEEQIIRTSIHPANKLMDVHFNMSHMQRVRSAAPIQVNQAGHYLWLNIASHLINNKLLNNNLLHIILNMKLQMLTGLGHHWLIQ